MNNGNKTNYTEEERADKELANSYSDRLNLPRDKWIKVPNGMGLFEFLKSQEKEESENK